MSGDDGVQPTLAPLAAALLFWIEVRVAPPVTVGGGILLLRRMKARLAALHDRHHLLAPPVPA